jgi:hypothetical protein
MNYDVEAAESQKYKLNLLDTEENPIPNKLAVSK